MPFPAYTELLASTAQTLFNNGSLVDNVTLSQALLDFLRPKMTSATGESLAINVKVKEGNTAQWSDDSGTHSTAIDPELIQRAQFDWSDPLITHTRLTFMDIEKNKGSKTQIIDLVRTHLEDAVEQQRTKISSALFALCVAPGASLPGGVTADDRGLEPGAVNSLDYLVSDQTSAGRLNPTTYPVWKSVRKYIPASGTGSKSIDLAMEEVVEALLDNGSSTNDLVAIAGPTVFSEYRSYFSDKTRFTNISSGAGSIADARFKEYDFDGIRIRRDRQCTTDRIYFLDVSKIRFCYMNDLFMKNTGSYQLEGKQDMVTPFVTVLALGTSSRRSHGVLIRNAAPSPRYA